VLTLHCGFAGIISDMQKPTPLSERRMVENEAIFRESNEKLQKTFNKLKQIAKEDGQEHLVEELDTALEFYCECSDENCYKRVKLTLSEHTRIHKNRSRFTVIGGHEVDSIEKVIEKKPDYYIVEKYSDPPESPGTLNATSVDNS
jgi:16S rRNA C1402 (ribose-2'-O) methylase RsmI